MLQQIYILCFSVMKLMRTRHTHTPHTHAHTHTHTHTHTTHHTPHTHTHTHTHKTRLSVTHRSPVLADCPVDAESSGQAALHPPTDHAQTPHQGATSGHTVTRGCLPLRHRSAQDYGHQAPLYQARLDAHEGRRLGS